ncbi:DUF1456 family protein [Flavobacterium suncheonense]|uniref:Uncharacterized protein n=1 Tax=Flavobacterium suncheonense GH29-5 = DSM 17707 TaxID=1121899 RepID=A0A0A2MDF9_9FLAO|nr:DUF1456 family protein [Flavobacterium suncheonense]KGO90677.1 hypothetical protein Q764_00715 [Flavobacterium suncheonense GH29-5 = DSM 17707]
MNNNDIFKKLRVALQLRDDQIVEILELVDFRISKGEIGNFFRNEDHPKYVDCGDQVLRNFLNGLVIHLRGTKENPKNPMEVLKGHKAEAQKNDAAKPKTAIQKPKADFKKIAPKGKAKPAPKKEPVVQNVKFKNGKKKDSK